MWVDGGEHGVGGGVAGVCVAFWLFPRVVRRC